MKKLFMGAMMLASMSALAQETYSDANLATEDLNGTARYVGMGGAMEALGADISTINTNPAGVGLFRRSQASMSFGLVSQAEAPSSSFADATNMSFDQAGFVWSNRYDTNRYVNFGFNYKKSRNFNQILGVQGDLHLASQNMLSYMKCMTTDDIEGNDISELDAIYWYALNVDKTGAAGYNVADGFDMDRGTKGYIGDYDFNISGNVSDRLYLGFTVGIKDVNYTEFSRYTESLLNGQYQFIGTVSVNDERRITGSGVNMKFGAIYFPVEGSPLRVGLNISTPTWYDLSSYNYTYLANNADLGFTPYNAKFDSEGTYDFSLYTPWKFGASFGHTIDNFIALGASFEYSDYTCNNTRYIYALNYYDGSSRSYADKEMNKSTKDNLRGVSTLKLGAEVKATPEVAIRMGYNFVSPMYRTTSAKDPYVWSEGNKYSTTYDYTNWKATNRLTCGVGYSKGNFSADLAYQYSATNGEFHPFADSYADIVYDDGDIEQVDNYADAVKVSNKRHQLIATLTFKF